MWPSPYDSAEAAIVETPFIEYQIETRRGCSARRYHWAVIMANRGKQPASNRPSKKRHAIRPPKLSQAAKQASAIPQPRTNDGIRMRCGTRTINHAEKGCHPSWAMGEIDPMREYWCPVRCASCWRLNTDPVPSTALSNTYGATC